MTRNLPDEILLLIFEELHHYDLLNCQQVCHSWYSSAHIKLLKEVTLGSSRAVQQFIASFDRNSKQSEFKAVKAIRLNPRRLNNSDLEHSVLERKDIEKLFFRFPNLENVFIGYPSLLTNFDVELSKTILSHCRKLDRFDVFIDVGVIDRSEFCIYLEKVCPLLTDLNLSADNYIVDVVDPVEFITQFPRLQDIYCEDESIDSFDVFLPVFEQLSNISNLHLAVAHDIEEDFGQEYFSTKSKKLRDLVKQRFSNVKDLHLHAYGDIGNTLKFVSEYFTGLERRFKLERDLTDWEPDAEQDLFFRNAFNLIPSVKGNYSAEFEFMAFASLSNSFTCLVQNMFNNVPSIHKQSNSRVLNVNISSRSTSVNQPGVPVFLDLECKQLPFSRNLRIGTDERIDLDDFTSQLFESDTAPMDQVDVFVLEFSYYNKTCKMLMDTEKYLRILGTMPSLKQAQLDVPDSFLDPEDQEDQMYTGPVLEKVEEAIFKVTLGGTMQTLLNSCYYTFPNLKRLDIRNFSVIHRGELFVDLHDYSIENLLLDTKPFMLKMHRFEFGYFVVKVETRSNGKQCLYKVPLDHSSCEMIDIQDLEGSRCGRDYLRIRININSLKQVELVFTEMRTIKIVPLC